MQEAFLGLRTTIVVTIALVMFITMLLISFLVLTITRKTIFDYKIKTGEAIVLCLNNAITSSPAPFVEKESPVQETIDYYAQHTDDLTRISVVDTTFTVAADTELTSVGSVNRDPLFRESLISGDVVKEVQPYQGNDHLFLTAPLYHDGRLKGFIQAVFSLRDLEATMARYQHTLILFMVTTALVFILIGSLLLTRYLVKPLKKLIRAADAITEGYLPQPLEATVQNEIGSLSISLSRMTEKLRDDKEEIENYIHSLKVSNSRLKRAQGDLIRSEKLSSVGRLAAGVAHEIGNPIGIILGYIGILRQHDRNTREDPDILRRLENEVMRIDRTIRELLSFSRPTAVEPHPIQVNPIIEEATAFISHQKAFSPINLRMHLADSLPSIMADERQLQQVLVNLFLNAIDAMPGGGTLSITTGVLDTDSPFSTSTASSPPAVSIMVQDTGTGIEAGDLDKIFDPFYTTKSPGTGTGLGLSVCLSIVESFGGTVGVESTPGHGTVFIMTFPPVSLDKVAHS